MEWVIYAVVGLLAMNGVIGAGVLAAIDRDGRLHAWQRNAPSPWLKFAVLQGWPVVAWRYYHAGERGGQ